MATAMRTNEELEMSMLGKQELSGYVDEFRKRSSTTCLRCGGFMVRDCNWHTACRCVQCGDVIDPVILRNRTRAGALFAEEPRRRKAPVFLRQSAAGQAVNTSAE